MTPLSQGRRPVLSAISHVMGPATAVCALALAGAVAFAQSWDPVVTPDIVQPKRAVVLPPPLVGPQVKPAPKLAPLTETILAPLPQPDTKAAMKAPPPVLRAKLETGSIKGTPAEEYCTNIANAAADARFAWQKRALAEIEQEIAKRIAVLEEKTADYQKWLARRDEFSKKANETVLRIYSRMRPDAAAVQLAALDEETAASVLTKLEPRTASLILNEMDPAQAVRLTGTISGAAKVNPATPKAQPEAKAK
jgi:flagellar motility protein MotE (MotC chaperone)